MISILIFYVQADNMQPESCGRIVAETEDEAIQKAKNMMTDDQKSRGVRISAIRMGENENSFPEWLCKFGETDIRVVNLNGSSMAAQNERLYTQ